MEITGIEARLQEVRTRMQQACARVGRNPAEVRLIAVSKKQPVEAIRAAIFCGHLDFGENYVQELWSKAQQINSAASAADWHFVGHLQRNKIQWVAACAKWIHTIDRITLIQSLGAHLSKSSGDAIQCLVQVNVGQEDQKSGCTEEDLPALLDAFAQAHGNLVCRGLMCIPPATKHPEESRFYFRKLRALRDMHSLAKRPHVCLQELSMGMSQDFEVAIEEGATMIRVGTALFGAR